MTVVVIIGIGGLIGGLLDKGLGFVVLLLVLLKKLFGIFTVVVEDEDMDDEPSMGLTEDEESEGGTDDKMDGERVEKFRFSIFLTFCTGV